jgi:hypothetical protein
VDQQTRDNWLKVKQALESAGKTDNHYYRNVYVRVSGTWKQASAMYVRDAGTWKAVTTVSVRDSGVWKT